ncbi:MAG: CPBP family intramembrane metalloprotease [Lachnospiraceae bacterium]|nr:CPBP family intramembrane metalloprotease [Lachnospiraceae bacterium]
MEAKKKNVIQIIITFAFTLLTLLFISWVNNIASNAQVALRLILPIVAWWPMLIPVIFFMRRDKETVKEIGFLKDKILLQILMGVIVAVGSLVIFIVLPALFGINMSYVGNLDIFAILYQFIYMMLAVALIEEIICRGYLFKKLLAINGSKWFAILVSSALFGLLHIFNWSLFQIIVTAVIGLYWCICREKLKHCTLLSLIIAHALHNTIHPIFTALFFG